MTDRHFGPEIVESQIGGDVVRDVKAATALLVGTFPVHEVHTDPAIQALYIDKPILIRRREDIATHFGAHTEGYTIAGALDGIFDQDLGKGVGTIEVVNVFDPAVHKDGANAPDPSTITNLDILGGFDASGEPSGLQHAYASYQRYGWFPKFVAAPGFTGLTGVQAELDVINTKIRARSYIDAPAGVTVQACLEARGPNGPFDMQTASRRLNPCYPHMKVVDLANAGATRVEPFSIRMLGIHLASIVAFGYQHSPSNREIKGIESPAQKVLYVPGRSDDDAQLLRGAGYVTAEERWGKGAHSAGNRSAAFPTDVSLENFIHVQLTADLLHEGILFFLDEYKDRNGTPATLTYVEGVINSWGQQKTVGDDPEILGFQFWFDRKKTTAEVYADGKSIFQFRFMPVGLLEWLQVESAIDLNLARDPLGLASA